MKLDFVLQSQEMVSGIRSYSHFSVALVTILFKYCKVYKNPPFYYDGHIEQNVERNA